jgi:hypothetical protein
MLLSQEAAANFAAISLAEVVGWRPKNLNKTEGAEDPLL